MVISLNRPFCRDFHSVYAISGILDGGERRLLVWCCCYWDKDGKDNHHKDDNDIDDHYKESNEKDDQKLNCKIKN